MNVTIVSTGIEDNRLRLQPFKTLIEMARQLVTLGHNVTIISDGALQTCTQEEVGGLQLSRLRSVRLYRGRRNAELEKIIAKDAPDVLLWHLGLSSFVHQDVYRRFSCPVIGICTSPINRPFDMMRMGVKKLCSDIDLTAIQFAGALVPSVLIRQAFTDGGLNGLITLSNTSRNYLIQKGVPSDRIWVVPPGVDPQWLKQSQDHIDIMKLRSQYGYTKNDLVVTYFGSPAPVRGIQTLLRAVAAAARSHSQIQLLILSRRWSNERHQQTAALNRLISSNGLAERVRVVDGYLAQEQLIRHIKASDTVCLPFELVPSDVPLSILESMALGRAVITTNVASLPELVGPDRGFLIAANSVSCLAQQLRQIADAPQMGRDRGQNARAYVATNRTWEKMGEKLEEVLSTQIA